MKSIRVAVLAERLGTSAGGTEVYERSLLNALHVMVQSVNDIEIVPVLAWRHSAKFLSPSLVPHCRFIYPEGRIGTALISGYHIRSLHPDVIHCCFVVPPFTGGAPIVTTIHDIGFIFHKEHYPTLLSARLIAALHRAIRRSDRLVAVSYSTRNDLLTATNARPDQIEVVYNGLDGRFSSSRGDHAFLNRYGIHPPYLLYAGKLEPRKNVNTLIEAYDRLRKNGHFQGQLVILGSSRTYLWKQAQQRINRSPYLNDIVQTGYVPDEARPPIYAGATALAFVSFYEGFGFPVIEAMASAVPVVCSNTTSLPEVAGDAAILVNPEDPDAIARALATVVNDDSARNRLIENGLKKVQEFTWEKAAASMIEIYRKLAAKSVPQEVSR